jgi:hypothetical protein
MSDERQRRSLSALAVAAAVCSIVTLLLLAADVVFHLSAAQRVLWGGWWCIVLILGPMVLGTAAGVRIALSGGKLVGWGFCLLGIITTLLGCMGAVYVWVRALSM